MVVLERVRLWRLSGGERRNDWSGNLYHLYHSDICSVSKPSSTFDAIETLTDYNFLPDC